MKYLNTYKVFENKQLQRDGYVIKSFRDEDDEGTFVMVYHPTKKDINNNPLEIAHLHVPDENIGNEFWRAGDVYVLENERRKGIASWMYNKMSETLGLNPSPSMLQSELGKKFWKKYKE